MAKRPDERVRPGCPIWGDRVDAFGRIQDRSRQAPRLSSGLPITFKAMVSGIVQSHFIGVLWINPH